MEVYARGSWNSAEKTGLQQLRARGPTRHGCGMNQGQSQWVTSLFDLSLVLDRTLAAWRSGSIVRRMNEVALRWARLVLDG